MPRLLPAHAIVAATLSSDKVRRITQHDFHRGKIDLPNIDHETQRPPVPSMQKPAHAGAATQAQSGKESGPDFQVNKTDSQPNQLSWNKANFTGSIVESGFRPDLRRGEYCAENDALIIVLSRICEAAGTSPFAVPVATPSLEF